MLNVEKNTLEQFKIWLELNKDAEETIKAYYTNVQGYFKFCNFNPTQENLNQYFLHLKNNYSKSKFNLFRISMLVFFEFSGLKLELPKNRKIDKKIQPYIKKELLQKVINQLQFIYTDFDRVYKITVVMWTFFYTGLRIKELTTCLSKDIDINNQEITVRNTKGNVDRKIPIIPELKRLLKNYKEKFPREDNETFFDITLRSFEQVCRNVKNNLKLSDFHPHMFRHGFGRYMINEKGISINHVKVIMGHSDIKITEQYAESDFSEIKESFIKKVKK
jgi:integrase/recombinase XerD